MTEGTAFAALANLCEELEKTMKRTEKTRLVSSFLRKLKDEEVASSVFLIIGTVFPESDPRVLEVSGRTISKIVRRSKQTALVQKPLTILNVYKTFENIAAASGEGSRRMKESLIASLLSQASPVEGKYVVRNLLGEMRVGVNEGMMIEAVAKACSVDLELVRRSHMLLGDLGELARLALKKGKEGLQEIGVQLFKPVKPMLAEMSYDIEEVLREHGGTTAFEHKYDGARIQIHKKDQTVKIYSRRLTDVTGSLPDIATLVKNQVNAEETLLEGEAVAIGADAKPLPFQDLMRRFRRVHEVDEMAKEIPIKLFLFDVLYLEGRTLIDTPYEERWRILLDICPPNLLATRIVTGKVEEAEQFLREAMQAGHEGLVAKSLRSLYTPGVRGKRWFKIKPAESLDLAIVAADWGYGRRTGWLSNYHLAAREEGTDEFQAVGKTFKGLTDSEFIEMTNRLQKIKVSEDEYTVYVKPEIVVEVAYNEIQKSPHYKSGFALRFARITKIRDDKSPSDANTIGKIRTLYEKQFEHKARIHEALRTQ